MKSDKLFAKHDDSFLTYSITTGFFVIMLGIIYSLQM